MEKILRAKRGAWTMPEVRKVMKKGLTRIV